MYLLDKNTFWEFLYWLLNTYNLLGKTNPFVTVLQNAFHMLSNQEDRKKPLVVIEA